MFGPFLAVTKKPKKVIKELMEPVRQIATNGDIAEPVEIFLQN